MTFGEQNTEADGHEQLDYALDQGINFIDTAEMYSVPARQETQGSTERIIGTWLASRKNRDKVILATKIAGPNPGIGYMRQPMGFSKANIQDALEASLQRLQTDYVDLYQLHWPERKMNMFGKRGFEYDPNDGWEDNFLEVLHTVQEWIKAGKIRHFGVSNESAWGLMHWLRTADQHHLPRAASIQNPYSLLSRLFEVGLAEVAIREQAGLLAYSPLAFGLLSDKSHTEGVDLSATRLQKYKQLSRYNGNNSKSAAAKYFEIAQEHGLSLAQMALAYVNTRPFLTSNIIGATTLEQLKENIDSIHVELSPEIMTAIEAVHQVYPDPAP
jgi:aryl-alcohol dehydrogenase-like predicted oxidoreductase